MPGTTEAIDAKQTPDYEKMFKDTQAAYTRGQQELKQTQAQVDALKELVPTKPSLTTEQETELEKLKFVDPDKWRAEMNIQEQEAAKAGAIHTKETLDKASLDAGNAFEIERRERVLDNFNSTIANPLTGEQIDKDVPQRIKDKLVNNEITFEAFLDEASAYLGTPKAVKGSPQTLNQPTLNGVVGGAISKDSKPAKTAQELYAGTMY